MTTIRQIVTDALRESAIIPVGSAPEADEYSEAVRLLNTLIKSFFGNEVGDDYSDYSYGQYGLTNVYATERNVDSQIDGYYIPSNSRLTCNVASTKTLYLNPAPDDGARLQIIDSAENFATYPLTLNANGRQIESAGTVALNTNGVNREWFYRADLADWKRLSDLTEDSDSPFPGEFDDMLILSLALRLNPRYGAETKGETSAMLKRARSLFKSRYTQRVEVGVEEGLTRLPSRKNSRRRTNEFEIGR